MDVSLNPLCSASDQPHNSGKASHESAYITSSMDAYKPPEMYTQIEGQRKKMLQQFYWKVASKEFFDELKKVPGEEDWDAGRCTTYNEHFIIPGFEVDDRVPTGLNPEIIARHPLYSDSAITIYSENIHHLKPSLKGKHPSLLFRKRSIFSKKWYDELE